MKEKVLVAYASQYGSTQEVADAIAGTLRESNLAVDLEPMKKVKSLAEYGAIVLGAPIYLGVLHKDMQSFLALHQEALTQQPPAIYVLGPLSMDEKEWQECRAMLDKELAKFSWLSPLAVEMFGGKYNPARLNLPHRLLTSLPASPLHGMPAKDLRDWTAIQNWGKSLVMKFQAALTE
ncbi:MAG TPA: flavodoxin domain-containing protein [Candidatus Binatia bacterium]|nr:flavodoxin domain-containing protein [Candidatus Binatia bacterium]